VRLNEFRHFGGQAALVAEGDVRSIDACQPARSRRRSARLRHRVSKHRALPPWTTRNGSGLAGMTHTTPTAASSYPS
jgi:hypothetical protein